MDKQGVRFLKDACAEARKWAKSYPTLAEAWDACTNPEWMCWALNKLDYNDSVALRRFACWCVRNTPLPDGRKVWDLLTDERSRRAVEVAEAFADGRATEGMLLGLLLGLLNPMPYVSPSETHSWHSQKRVNALL